MIPWIYRVSILRKWINGQWVTTGYRTDKKKRNTLQTNQIHRLARYHRDYVPALAPDIYESEYYTTQQLAVIEAILRSERISQGQLIPCAMAPECELNFQFGFDVVAPMIDANILTRWATPHTLPSLTLTPHTAAMIGYRIKEVLIRWYRSEVQYVGNRYTNMRRRTIRIVCHDFEPCWMRAAVPVPRYERSVINPLERPIDECLSEIEDKQARKFIKDYELGTMTDDESEAYKLLDVPVAPLRKPGRKKGSKNANVRRFRR